ncbi:hypothetical protein [Priestia flexa]|uniref:hypothetical protein n=1 Tax=Priestia flexa TaxID=86664 RepID=UPI0028902D50|nr:hypothetical protein [Priestia flexa]MDT2047775.1 hypothetical protein [Priestia flexa]
MYIFDKYKKLKGDNKTIILNIIFTLLIKGGSLVLALFTLPAYMQYFDNKVILGVWLTIVAFLNWILLFDLGIGNGLRNKLVKPLIEGNMGLVKSYISSAYISLSFISIVVSVVVYKIIDMVNWNAFFGVDSNYISNDIFIEAIRIVLLGTLIQFVLRIITSILYAMQKSFVPNLLQLSSTLLLIIYIYLGLYLGASSLSPEENLIHLAYANILTVNLPLFVVTLVIFQTSLKGCFPKFKRFEKKYAQDIMKLGIAFLWLQIVYMIITNTNEFFITWLIGAESVVEYQVYYKLFTLSGTLMAIALTPIWSAVTKAKAEHNYIWIQKLNKILMCLGALGVLFSFLMIPFLQSIINLWLGDNSIKVNYTYSVIFAISGGIFLWNRIISTMCNGFGELKVQMIFLTFGAVVNFPLAYFLAATFESYIAIVMANIVSMLPYCIVQPIWMNKLLKQKEIKNKKSVIAETLL